MGEFNTFYQGGKNKLNVSNLEILFFGSNLLNMSDNKGKPSSLYFKGTQFYEIKNKQIEPKQSLKILKSPLQQLAP